MSKFLIIALLVLLPLRGSAQAVNPQTTFPAAVNVNNPFLWLNFNDLTDSFKDSVSGLTLTPLTTPAYNTYCTNGVSSSTTSTSCSLTNVGPGSAIIVFFSISPTSISDSGGATYTSITSTTGAYAGYFGNVSGGNHTITLSYSSSVAYPILQVTVVANVATSSPIDAYSSNHTTGTTTTFTSGSLTTTQADDILVGFQLGNSSTYSFTSPVFTGISGGGWTGIFQGHYLATTAGPYAFTGNQSSSSGYSNILVAVKQNPGVGATPQQPGFDNTNNANYSAEYTWNGWTAAPNLTLGNSMEWDTPWTMLYHIDKFNWDHSSNHYVLASRGDLNTAGVQNVWWQLFIQQNSGNTAASQLCFYRQSPAPYTATTGAMFLASQEWCTATISDVMPNGFNYDIVIEDNGTGNSSALSIWVNGIGQTINTYNMSGQGFGGVTLAVTSGGSGYTSAPTVGSTGGGPNCTVAATATESGGAITAVGSVYSQGCTSTPTITLTGGGGTGAAITATTYVTSMISPIQPLLIPGSVNAGAYYGPGGTDTSQNPLYVDEFAIFPGNLSAIAVTNIFNETKFYQNLLYPNLTKNPPLVIFGSQGCGPDYSGDQTMAMVINAAKAGLIRLIGINDDDGAASGSNSLAWFRQILDQAGFADVPVASGSGSNVPNLGGCPAANLTAYNANTPQNPSSYESATTMYRTLFADYPTTPIYVMSTQTMVGYSQFQASAADSISPLTGMQLQQQNYNNGGWVNAFEGNFANSPASYLAALNSMGTSNNLPIYFESGSPAVGGPGTYNSRTVLDPLYQAAKEMGTGIPGDDQVTGWTNQNLAQLISPYFNSGIQIAVSGGTGYASGTALSTIGGGPNCKVAGIMLSSGGVPSSVVTPNYSAVATTYNGLGYGCYPVVFTANGSGTNLTVSSITCCNIGPNNLTSPLLTVGDTIVGTGVPEGTTILSQSSGTPGGAGVYVTSAATTAMTSAPLTRVPTVVLTTPTGTGAVFRVTLATQLKTYEGSATASYVVWPNVWAYGNGGTQIFQMFENSLINPISTGAPREY